MTLDTKQNSTIRRQSIGYYKAVITSCLVLGLLVLPFCLKAQSGPIILLRSSLPEEPLHVDTMQADLEHASEEEIVQPEAVMDEDQILLETLRNLGKTDGQVVQEDASQWQMVRMKVTAYCPCRICCGKHSDGITASNHRIQYGDVFVASDKMFSFGTEMIIPGYNNGRAVEVEDRGRLIKGHRLDVFFNSHQRAKQWGCRELDVLVKVD